MESGLKDLQRKDIISKRKGNNPKSVEQISSKHQTYIVSDNSVKHQHGFFCPNILLCSQWRSQPLAPGGGAPASGAA